MRRTAILCLLLLSACAGLRTGGEDLFTWGFNPATDQEGAKLVHGQEETDNVGLWFICDRANRTVRVLIDAPDEAPSPPAISIRSGLARGDYPIKTVHPEGTLEALASIGDPVLQAFARTGALTYAYGDTRINVSARTPAERRSIHDFQASCL